MHHNTRIDSRHIFTRSGKNITEFVKEANVHLDFIGRTSDSNMDVLDNPRFEKNFDRHHLGDVTQVTFSEDFMS